MDGLEKDSRPWGGYEVLASETTHKVKCLSVLPEQQLSYQSHQFRSEYWVVVEGVAEVCLNDVWLRVEAGNMVFIPLQAKHRLKNPLKDRVLKVIEVQVGSSFEESDITRFEDDYARAPKAD